MFCTPFGTIHHPHGPTIPLLWCERFQLPSSIGNASIATSSGKMSGTPSSKHGIVSGCVARELSYRVVYIVSQILMEEYEGRGRDGFRSEWSRNGKLTPSHQILTALRSSGRDKSKEMVIAAKETYTGPLFDKMFSYRGRDGSVKILTSPIAISKRYLKLHPDASPPSQCRDENRVARLPL